MCGRWLERTLKEQAGIVRSKGVLFLKDNPNRFASHYAEYSASHTLSVAVSTLVTLAVAVIAVSCLQSALADGWAADTCSRACIRRSKCGSTSRGRSLTRLSRPISSRLHRSPASSSSAATSTNRVRGRCCECSSLHPSLDVDLQRCSGHSRKRPESLHERSFLRRPASLAVPRFSIWPSCSASPSSSSHRTRYNPHSHLPCDQNCAFSNCCC